MKLKLPKIADRLATLTALRAADEVTPAADLADLAPVEAVNGDGAAPLAPEEQPLRSELFSIEQLEQHATSLAGWHTLDPQRVPDRLFARLDENEQVLLRAYELISDAVAENRRIVPAAEWLLDNFYLVEEQIRTARRHLPKNYSRELPRLSPGANSSAGAGYPRVYDLALELISHVDGRVDAENLSSFIAGYQSVTALKLGELWAVPIMIRLALLENLRRVAARLSSGRIDRDRANHWSDRMIDVAEKDPKNLVLVLADMVRGNPPLTSAFVAEMARRLQGQAPALTLAMSWIEQHLAESGATIGQLVQIESQNQASDQVSIGNSINSLRFLSAMDWREFVETHSAVEQTLRSDPADVYSKMDFTTRDRYRHAVEKIAKRSRLTEDEVALEAIRLARETKGRDDRSDRTNHVGYYLVDRGLNILERRAHMRKSLPLQLSRFGRRLPLISYAAPILLFIAVVTFIVCEMAHSRGTPAWALFVLGAPLIFTVSHLAFALVNWLSTLIVTPRTLPRLDFSEGIPSDSRTLVVVPTMLTSDAAIDDLLESIEVRYIANRDRNLFFALLTDFVDAPKEHLEDDDRLLDLARKGIESLNKRYVGDEGDADISPRQNIFYLLHRPRKLNAAEGCWMGWERKRGKLADLNAVLRGTAAASEKFSEIVGDVDQLGRIKYVITLDSDTQLPRDAAEQLVGTIAHPLNRPRFDPRSGRVVEGYGILQPRVAISLPSASRSWFVRIFAGDPGVDPYTRAVSDVYQDVFEEGSFIGKGIYDIDAFEQALAERFPENRVLSHDLLEGSHVRSALLSDVLLFEDHPSRYSADVSRRHRWIRGDWQISAWLLPLVPSGNLETPRVRNAISTLSRWKILDNLRRSLVPVAMTVLLILAFVLPVPVGLVLGTIAAVIFIPTVLHAITALVFKPRDLPANLHLRFALPAILKQLAQSICLIILLPFEAYISADAIVRTTVRVCWSKRKLLEWRTASDAERDAHAADLFGVFTAMWVSPLIALLAGAALLFSHRGEMMLGLPIVVLWMLAPGVAWFLSQPIAVPQPKLTDSQLLFLRKLTRRTWRFFETFVTAADNFLPPDNYQEHPTDVVAHRTSPTNIGLALLANLSAKDFGYISAGAFLDRTESTIATMEKMERHRGHLLNWYDTRSLAPLNPRYVSTVDSGNLAIFLLTLRQGLIEMEVLPVISPRALRGLDDTLAIIIELLRDVAANVSAIAPVEKFRTKLIAPSHAMPLMKDLLNEAMVLAQSIDTEDAELRWWIDALRRQASDLLADANLVPLGAEESPTLRAMAGSADESVSAPAVARIARLQSLVLRIEGLAEMEWEFLFDKSRDLLSIGYNLNDHRLDASFYDLLASEARVASYVAIAEGKLPQEHWFALGRLLTSSGREPALLSWSGSMFEYLLPICIMPNYENTLLAQTYRAVMHRQIEYGQQRGVPWGISESGYNITDASLNYQYRAFGVPGLGFKRGLAEDLVIAPYASVMALMIDPEAACENLERLADEGILARYGFYEALDYTPARVPRGQTFATIRSFMSHHQGMSLLSLECLLLDRPMQRRFEADPVLRANELLLQERVPKVSPVYPHAAEVAGARRGTTTDSLLRVFTTAQTAWPEVHLLSNGRYHVMVSAAGGGYSRWRDLAVTRWREDPTRDCFGTFLYLRDLTSGDFWSAAHQPTLQSAKTYEAIFPQSRAEFRRNDGEIESHCEIAVSPEDDIELRRLTLTNRGRSKRTIELTTYAEVVLAPPAADAAHSTFSDLFVQTELLKTRSAILCTRRPRSAGEKPPYMMHLMAVHASASASDASFETDRSKFVGRGRTSQDPAAMDRWVEALSDSEGSVLDPIVAIRRSITLDPQQSVRIDVVTGVSETRDGAVGLLEKYHDHRLADRVLELAWTHSQVILRQLNATEAEAQLYARLASSVLYATPARRSAPGVIARNRRSQSGLWGYGISGDLPIVLLRVSDQTKQDLVRQVVQAHAYWRLKGLEVDLVVWNEDPSGYRQQLHDAIMSMVTAGSSAQLVDRPGGIFVRRAEQIAEEDKLLMQAAARVVLSDNAGTLEEQLDRRAAQREYVGRFIPTRMRRTDNVPVAVELFDRDLVFFNGTGGFTRDGREYVISTASSPLRVTPAPWCNVLANAQFGTVISESGGAYTWLENAHEMRLTTWHNDPVCDTSGEAFYIRDEETGKFWSPAPLPARGAMPYTTRHGFGYTVFEYEENGLRSEMWTYVATEAAVKFVSIRIRNTSSRPRRVSITGFVEWVLGELRHKTMPHVVTELDPRTGAIMARNAYNNEFGNRVAFFDCSEATRTLTGDRTEFIGRNGTLANPAAMARAKLSGRVGASFDPCAAMQATIELNEGQEREIVFNLGAGRDEHEAKSLLQRFRTVAAARRELDAVWHYWGHTLGTINVQSPDPALNILANGWLAYQVLACRFWARSGFYQSGGAFGFRDQLQDVMALLYAEPRLYREHLLRCAGRQFKQGDVQHWWHPPTGRGVRTHFSDDYLWLPYAVCRFVNSTGDTGVLDEKINFLEGRPVSPDEESYYDLPARSEETGTLYDHCVRAIENGLKFGVHGLPLIGCGDWNDGMNLVGAKGKGESVWLAFFLYNVLKEFAGIATQRNDAAFAQRWQEEAEKLQKNIEEHAWDGAWYRRAYFDDGTPLGSASNPECQIDSLPQSWAVLSGAGEPARARQALAAVDARLVKRTEGLIQLFEPPFDKSDLNPGYIKGYVPGVRENGGQYTHAAVWTVMAFALVGDTERAWELFNLINPIHHGDRIDKINTYKVEPYVVAADVYAVAPHVGRGGWTWYTGSAGWTYRLIIESFLGMRLTVDRLHFEPVVPPSWKSYVVHYRFRETVHHITIRFEGPGRAVQRVILDGQEQTEKYIQLVDDRLEHQAEVILG